MDSTYRIPTTELDEFAKLPIGHQEEIRTALRIMWAVDHAPHNARLSTWDIEIRNANSYLEHRGIRTTFKRQTLYGLRKAYHEEGLDWAVLVDRRKVPDWSALERRRVNEVPEATVQWMMQIAEQYKGREKTCLKQAWKRCIAVWQLSDEPIPGCEVRPPAGRDGIPDGWSYSNFLRLVERPKYVKRMASTGAKAASALAFHIPTTRVGLEVGEIVMIDDVWHDFKVKRRLTSAPMRLLELCALDLYSGKKVCYGLKPEVMDDDTGVRQRLQGRDMRFLMAALFSLHGFRPAGTTIVGEGGTAHVPDDVLSVLADASDGAITFKQSAIRDTPAFPGWYKARGGGNPRYKAALESSFNLLHNATAMLTGQTGSNERVSAPEELHGREEYDKSLVKAIRGVQLSRERELMIRAPFMLYSQAAALLGDIYKWLDGRTDHDLEGFEQSGLVTGEVRIDPASPNWTPAYAMQAGDERQEAALQALMHLPGCYRMRKLAPAEVWESGAARMARISMSVLPAIIGRDLAQERAVNDHGSFLFEDASLSAEPLRYQGIAKDPRGHEIMLREGEKYLTFCNPFDPRYLLVCDSDMGYIGRCLRVERVSRADDAELARAMGQSAHVNALRARAFLGRHAHEAADRESDEAVNERLLSDAPYTAEEMLEDAGRRDVPVADSDRDAVLAGDTGEPQQNFSAAEIADLLKT
jgi:hypothetical protein